MVETGIALARPCCRIGVDFLEIAQHSFYRRMKTVEVEAVKPDPFSTWRKRVVVRPQPLNELDHHGVAPHPCREAANICQCFHRVDVVAAPTTKAVTAIGVRA